MLENKVPLVIMKALCVISGVGLLGIGAGAYSSYSAGHPVFVMVLWGLLTLGGVMNIVTSFIAVRAMTAWDKT